MKFCEHCGKELLSDDDIVCFNCGCPIQTQKQKKGGKLTKANKLWIILGGVALLLGVVACILFMPRNLKMNDFKETNVVTAIIAYGFPENIRTDEDGYVYLNYGGRVDFYGITPQSFAVYPDEGKVVFFFRDDDEEKVYDKIDRICDFEENLLNIFHKFSYDDMEITTYDYDGSYVSIEIN